MKQSQIIGLQTQVLANISNFGTRQWHRGLPTHPLSCANRRAGIPYDVMVCITPCASFLPLCLRRPRVSVGRKARSAKASVCFKQSPLRSNSIWSPLPPHTFTDDGISKPIHAVISRVCMAKKVCKVWTSPSSTLFSFFFNSSRNNYKCLWGKIVIKYALLSPYLNNYRVLANVINWCFSGELTFKDATGVCDWRKGECFGTHQWEALVPMKWRGANCVALCSVGFHPDNPVVAGKC